MKTTVKELSYERVSVLPRPKHKKPVKPNIFWRTLIRLITIFGMKGTKLTYTTEGMEKIGKKEPCLSLMNHSCFLDMQIAYRTL